MAKQRSTNERKQATADRPPRGSRKTSASRKEKRFYDSLRDMFVGAKVEGESGYINLMKIKSRYYEKGVFPKLKQDIEERLQEFPEFREELFDKLYSFFGRYFSESGSIHFCRTSLHQHIYEKVYTDDRDVMLFWKTHMAHYVKTERLFENLAFELEGFKFRFDVSALEHKGAIENREIVHGFETRRKDGTLVFNVTYSKGQRKTRVDKISRELKKQGVQVREDILERAIRIFNRQSEMDYFLNKNARAFLEEQFNLWLSQYVFSGESDWTEQRIRQLQGLRSIAFKIIDFISQFEHELVRIWKKPKFVLNSSYVISLDRVAEKNMGLVESLLRHKNFKSQVEEWKKLGIVDNRFKKGDVVQNGQAGKRLYDRYTHLPIDTKYFKDIELEILGLFSDLDEALDGWLIKSENYQALNTLLPKFGGQVQTIYIDPPFNTGDDFYYMDRFRDSTWLTLMHNRLDLAKDFVTGNGALFLHLDWNANYLGRHLLEELFGGFSEIIWNTDATKDEEAGLFSYKTFGKKYVRQHDTIFLCSRQHDLKFVKLWKPNRRTTTLPIGWLDLISYPKKGKAQRLKDYAFYIERYAEDGELRLHEVDTADEKVYAIGDVWNDIYSFMQSELRTSENVGFPTQKPETLLRRIIQSTSEQGDMVMDFFVGSGTTTSVAHKLRRKWIGIESGEYFWEFYNDGKETKLGLLGRMKIVLSGDKQFLAVDKKRRSHLSKDINWQGGGFFKYYELEQYEATLSKAKYEDSDLFDDPYQDPYHQYVFMRDLKMLDALKLDLEQDKVKVDLSKLYENIDIAETLSNLKGKPIRRIVPGLVEFEDGEEIDITNLDYRLILPLIWWRR